MGAVVAALFGVDLAYFVLELLKRLAVHCQRIGFSLFRLQ
jgi:hypothetical protein